VSTDDLPEDVATLADRLRAGRPAPSAALRRRVHELSLSARPVDEVDESRARIRIAVLATAGTLLLAIGALITFL
jgi:hypothetical protein